MLVNAMPPIEIIDGMEVDDALEQALESTEYLVVAIASERTNSGQSLDIAPDPT